MDNLIELYNIAERNHIDIDEFFLQELKAFATEGAIVLNSKAISCSAELKVILAHELGHHMKNAFYDIETTLETRERLEARAIRWAVAELIPIDKLKKAFKLGYVMIYELAEYFNVTEDFMLKAIDVYKVTENL